MAGAVVNGGPRYWAFISYSHKDAAFGRRLHRRLETYALPRRLIGRATPQGVVSTRLAPIFRDREELPAAHDLSAEVQAALKESRSLIVVCSPDAAASRWVSREVELYRALHPERPILAAIRSGEPGECFPAALIHCQADGTPIEPLAADFRRGRDGEHLGLLKLVAGIAGLGLDELAQRDAQRHRQRVTAVTAASLAAVLGMGALTAYALKARTEAEHQRSEAEGLVEFMLTDLRDRLKGVGRLDVMTAVNERALHYYSDEDLNSLSVDSLERRARILHAMGEDDEMRGDDLAALAKFREAERTTAKLLARSPDDPERIYDQAQSEFYIGLHEYSAGRFAAARSAFTRYRDFAEKLVSVAPRNPRFRKELGYADGNLCTVALEKPKDPKAAVYFCAAALNQMEAARRDLKKTTKDFEIDLTNRHAWLADAYRAIGDRARARRERLVEKAALDQLIVADPLNMDLRDTWVALELALAVLDEEDGNKSVAMNRLANTLDALDAMTRRDPNNQRWESQRKFIASWQKKLTQIN